jgi:hypothetical protein
LRTSVPRARLDVLAETRRENDSGAYSCHIPMGSFLPKTAEKTFMESLVAVNRGALRGFSFSRTPRTDGGGGLEAKRATMSIVLPERFCLDFPKG